MKKALVSLLLCCHVLASTEEKQPVSKSVFSLLAGAGYNAFVLPWTHWCDCRTTRQQALGSARMAGNFDISRGLWTTASLRFVNIFRYPLTSSTLGFYRSQFSQNSFMPYVFSSFSLPFFDLAFEPLERHRTRVMAMKAQDVSLYQFYQARKGKSLFDIYKYPWEKRYLSFLYGRQSFSLLTFFSAEYWINALYGFPKQEERPWSYTPAKVGFTLGVHTLSMMPVDLVKTRLQEQELVFSWVNVLKVLPREKTWWESLKSLYRGIAFRSIRNIPGIAYTLYFMDTIRSFEEKERTSPLKISPEAPILK